MTLANASPPYAWGLLQGPQEQLQILISACSCLFSMSLSPLNTHDLHDLSSDSHNCLPYKFYDVSLENLVLD